MLRTQWLTEQTFSDLAGKTVLIVDEVRAVVESLHTASTGTRWTTLG